MLCGCATKRTITLTEIKERIDTLFIYQPTDTVTIYKDKYLLDTVIIETEAGVSRAYVSLDKRKINLEFTPKPIPIKVKFERTITTKIKEVIPKKSGIRLSFLFFISCLLIILILILRKSKWQV